MAVVLSQLSSALPLSHQRGASFLWSGSEKNFLSPDGIHYRQVLHFTERLAGGEQEPREDAVTEECTENVTRAIEEHGGTTRLGWMIWEEDFMIEAIFHAVWENPDGRTVDVTPQDIPVDRIMFVPDPALQYEGRQIPNVRLNISGMMAVDHLIRLNELKFAIQNAGDRADQHRIMITPTESKALQWLETYRDAMSGALSAGMTDTSPCFCGSGRPYDSCHAAIFKESFAEFEKMISTIEKVSG